MITKATPKFGAFDFGSSGKLCKLMLRRFAKKWVCKLLAAEHCFYCQMKVRDSLGGLAASRTVCPLGDMLTRTTVTCQV
jgi:hypothetical protein